MDLFLEAGIFSIVSFVIFLAGIVLCLRRPRQALVTACATAAVIMGLSMIGAGLGQRLVDRAVEGEPDSAKKVAMLSMGTREAAANDLLGGLFGMSVVLLGSAVHLARKED